jgi:hypothetical protein
MSLHCPEPELLSAYCQGYEVPEDSPGFRLVMLCRGLPEGFLVYTVGATHGYLSIFLMECVHCC